MSASYVCLNFENILCVSLSLRLSTFDVCSVYLCSLFFSYLLPEMANKDEYIDVALVTLIFWLYVHRKF